MRIAFEGSDVVRLFVVLGVGTWVWLNRSELAPTAPLPPPDPEAPVISSPQSGARVKAGIVEFTGRAPAGSKIELMENGELLGIGESVSGEWSIRGKLCNEGRTAVFARAVGGRNLESLAQPLIVEGSATPTLSITSPAREELLTPGRYMFRGLAKPFDEVRVTYNGVFKFKTTANSEGRWWKAYEFNQPALEARILAISESEGEVVEVLVTGTG